MVAGPLVAMRATPLLFPATGVAHYIRSLARELTREGERIALFTPFHWDIDPARTEAHSQVPAQMRRSLLGAMPRPRSAVRVVEAALLALQAWLRAVALYHEPATLALPYAGPMVLTVHDLSWIRYPDSHPADRRRTLEREFPRRLRSAQHVLTDSDFVKAELVSTFGLPDRIVTTAPLAARACFHPRTEEETAHELQRLGLRHRGYFLSVGTLEPRKNLATAIRAYSQLPSTVRSRFPFVLVGASGWNTSGLERDIGRLASCGQLVPVGYASDETLACLYSSARASVYLSLYEGFGLPPLEALASGTPVLISTAGALVEVVGDAGLQVDPLDDARITAAMLQLAEDDDQCRSLGTAGLQRAALYSWTRCAAKTRDVYRSVLQTT